MQTPEAIIITLPIPPASLGGNSRTHHHAKANDTKRCREAAHVTALGLKAEDMPWKQCRVSAKFFFDRRTREIDKKGLRRDQENFMMRLKAYYDGFIDAGICPDDDWAHMRKVSPDLSGYDKQNPRVEFTIEKLTAKGI